ncbi:MAG: lytic transglycosylase domain-containing protein [Pyrinomonadaceae bacterium]
MQKTILLTALTLLLGTSAIAQNRARVFDNFDTADGVRVVTPTVEPIVSSKPVNSQKSSAKNETKLYPAGGNGVRTTGASSQILRMGSSPHLKGFTTGDATIDSYIVESSKRYNIDPLLIYAQMHQESAFKLRATSHKGASGLMQLMPATARRFGVTRIYDPQQNIDAGVKYMRWLLNKFNGDVVLALAGYNAGEGAVMKYGWQVPPYRETREYVRRISSRYTQISNPVYVKDVKQIEESQLAELEKEEPKSLEVVEVEVMTVRLPDGRMRLVTR